MTKPQCSANAAASGRNGTALPGATYRLITVLVRSETTEPGTSTKCVNARQWQSQNVARSIEDMKHVNGSRE